jgi:hypothetical protein
MKTLSGTFRLVVLAALAVGVVITLHAFAQPASQRKWPPKPGNCKPVAQLPPINAPHSIQISNRRELKDNSDQGEAAFAALLCNGHYDSAWGNRIHFIHKNANLGQHCLPQDCSDFAQASIKTDKVIVSDAAKNGPERELTSIQFHATQQVACQTQADLDAVVNLLK